VTPPTRTSVPSSGIVLEPEIPICQTDLPLDWYQEEFKPYAEEYLALPDRTPESVLPWLDSYVRPAQEHFGDALMLVAHFYMGGEIVKLVERYGGSVADSYVLALQAQRHPEKKVIVESAVHFMAEAIAILANDNVWQSAKDVTDLPEVIIERLRHYFSTYKMIPGKTSETEVSPPYDAEQAFRVVEAAMQDYGEEFGA